jgi:hypothetical protein
MDADGLSHARISFNALYRSRKEPGVAAEKGFLAAFFEV